MLANVYLHYALDLWFHKAVKPTLSGRATLLRFADDFVVLFEREAEATRFATELPKRLAKFNLSLAEEKTRLLPFGRWHWKRGQAHPHHFDFLGFRHHLGTSRNGRMQVVRIPCPKSVRRFLAEVKEWIQRHRHDRPWNQQRTLTQKLRGFYQYFSLWHTSLKLRAVKRETIKYWKKTLDRRSQRGSQSWEEWAQHPWATLPEPKLIHRTV